MDNIYKTKDFDSLRQSVTIQNLGQAARLGLADLKDLIPHFKGSFNNNKKACGHIRECIF